MRRFVSRRPISHGMIENMVCSLHLSFHKLPRHSKNNHCFDVLPGRLLFGSVELDLLLLEPGVELTVWHADPDTRALITTVVQSILGSEVASRQPWVWWSDQI
eukprot:COSAG02_NODE_5457_length_4302_cov_2.364977_4_plen_103_part_00